ncbi:galactose-1-phosphate uridylyltransferase-like isoform X2 [Gordionus sp. m RMFG-2023]|uniref:galactose-1-phosphate uridylyltransferase-like isoform X2 n=1 Tax=Gordionus sp. m RMFG-2023 TaxID=3053472 RepID=UPI0031FD5199
MSKSILQNSQHIRFNPLKEEWILICPQRIKRPWMGKTEKEQENRNVTANLTNPLLPGAIRANSQVNEHYTSTYIFNNDFPAMLPFDTLEISDGGESKDDLFDWERAYGECKVMCFSPNPEMTLALMDLNSIENIIIKWIDFTKEMSPKYTWIQIFENKGEIMGCSNPHPHCQIWASSFLPNEPRIKDRSQRVYFQKHKTPLLLDYCHRENVNKERLIETNDSWIIVIPFWANWPFETMVLPKRHILRFSDMDGKEIKGAPTGSKYLNENVDHWLFHGMYYPPLLRSANIKKFMVGYELLAQVQRDLTPEKAAEILRLQPNEIHYSKRNA